MISQQAIGESVHVLLDRLQNSGDQQDYYRINHVGHGAIQSLEAVLWAWLAIYGVTVEPLKKEGEKC